MRRGDDGRRRCALGGTRLGRSRPALPGRSRSGLRSRRAASVAVDGSLPGQNTVGSADIIDSEVTASDLDHVVGGGHVISNPNEGRFPAWCDPPPPDRQLALGRPRRIGLDPPSYKVSAFAVCVN